LFEKKQIWYSFIEVWLIVAYTYKEFECVKYLIYEPPLVYKGFIGWRSSFKRSRNCLPIILDTWNIIFQILEMLSYSLFLSKFQDNLYGDNSVRLKSFVSLSTMEWIGHLSLLGQSKKSIEFERSLIKNSLSFFNMAIDWC